MKSMLNKERMHNYFSNEITRMIKQDLAVWESSTMQTDKSSKLKEAIEYRSHHKQSNNCAHIGMSEIL